MKKLVKLLSIWSWGMAFLVAATFLVSPFFEIFITPAFSLILFFLIYKEMASHPEGKVSPWLHKSIPWVLLFSILFFFEGIGIHSTGNFLARILLEGGFWGWDPISLSVYFFDEILGHCIMYTGLFGLLVGGMLLQISRPFSLKLERSDLIALPLSAGIFGIGLATALVEGQTALYGFAAGIVLMPFLVLHHYHKKLKVTIHNYPFNFYLLLAILAMLIVLLVHYFTFGSFVQYSVLLGEV